MGQRLQFHELLEAALGSDEVHFQPSENISMVYPAIVYHLDDLDARRANNNPYTITTGYLVTHIDRDPDSQVPMRLAHFQHSDFATKYEKNGLHHTAFNIYY